MINITTDISKKEQLKVEIRCIYNSLKQAFIRHVTASTNHCIEHCGCNKRKPFNIFTKIYLGSVMMGIVLWQWREVV